MGEEGIKKQFNIEEIAAIRAGKEKIPGFTWHHHQDTGRMQLIKQNIHAETAHIGGNTIQKGK